MRDDATPARASCSEPRPSRSPSGRRRERSCRAHLGSQWAVHDLTLAEARGLASQRWPPRGSARASATWCGTARQADLAPNAVAGHPVHWV